MKRMSEGTFKRQRNMDFTVQPHQTGVDYNQPKATWTRHLCLVDQPFDANHTAKHPHSLCIMA